MEYPEDVRYSPEHEWARLEDGRVRVGITDFAQDALGDVVYVELPRVGTEVAANGTCSEVESTKSVSEIYAPIAGTIVEVNEALRDAPETINAAPYGDGWMFVLAPSDLAELDGLLDAAAYRSLVDEH